MARHIRSGLRYWSRAMPGAKTIKANGQPGRSRLSNGTGRGGPARQAGLTRAAAGPKSSRNCR
jgi:hypothetical protein